MSLGETVREQTDAIKAAAASVDGVDDNVTEYGEGPINPPCVVLGPPAIDWSGQGGGAVSTTRRLVYVVAPADSYALYTLLDLAEAVGDAIEQQVSNAVALNALPGTYQDGGTDLPAYEITIETSL